MKTLLLSILLIISALLLIASTGYAQSKDTDRDWIDSLAVKYRLDFIESAMLHDRVALDSMAARINLLILCARSMQKSGKIPNDDLVKAIQQFDDEKQAHQVRKYAYKEEARRLARTNFSSL